jgi:protein phosphatase
LLCSDGLSGELDARSIGRVLAGFDDPQAAADRLVELALAGAARDNVTALVVDLDGQRCSS